MALDPRGQGGRPHAEQRRGAVGSVNLAAGLLERARHDVALLLNESANIFVRSGMHCTHLYHNEVIGEKQGTVRPSLYIYNTEEELAAFFDALKKVVALA